MSASEPSVEQEQRTRSDDRVLVSRYATDEDLLALPGAELSENQQPKIDHVPIKPN